MTAIASLISTVNDWLGDRDYSDDLITSWVRMAEERFNNELRVADMVKLVTLPVVSNEVLLPDDWQKSDFVRSVTNGPLGYVSRDVFYSSRSNKWKFTITGKTMPVGDNITGSVVVSYFSSVPVLGDTPTWLSSKHSSLLLNATLVAALAYGVEDARAASWESYVSGQISKLNDAYTLARTSGSTPQVPRKRRFG